MSMIAINVRGLFREEITNRLFFPLKCCLPVVSEVGGVITMKSIDMYIIHDSSLVVSFSNISHICVNC